VGNLEIDGTPASGDFELSIAYFLAADDTVPCGEEVGIPVLLNAGAFSTLLIPPLICLTEDSLFLELAVRRAGEADYVSLVGRQRVVPALNARSAEMARSAMPEPFVAEGGVHVGGGNPARMEAVTGLAGLGVTDSGVRIAGPSNAHVVIDILANGNDDAFAVRVPAAPAIGAPATEVAFQVQGSGRTVVESLDARSISGLVGGGGAPGCVPLGEVQICWGHYTSDLGGSTQATFAQPFADAAYSLTCTPNGDVDQDIPRFCMATVLQAGSFRARTFSPEGGSSIGGSYIAIGRR
jgi:hypothetical protein